MSITLCMIVKDESRFLPGCLQSVDELVDQVVVVDTGSTDETVALAWAAGARVVHHEWRESFAAARNAALPHATGDYVLILDADERLTTEGRAVIRRACSQGAADGFLLPLHNASRTDASLEAVVSGEARAGGVAFQARIFRRTPDLRWEGVIHETPRTWLDTPRRVVVPLPAPVVHFGYVDHVVQARGKPARNERLLRVRCEQEPDRPDPRIYLAHTLLEADRTDEAWRVLQEAWTQVASSPPAERMRAPVVMLATELLTTAFREPSAVGARYATEALDWGLIHPNVAYLAGMTLERHHRHASGDLDTTRRAYELGLSWRGASTVPLLDGVQTWRLPLRLGVVSTRLGHPARAIEVLRQADAAHPNHPPIHVAWAEAICAAGDPAGALQRLEPWMPHSADAWWVAGWAMASLGDVSGSDAVLSRAASHGAPEEPHRMHLSPLVTT